MLKLREILFRVFAAGALITLAAVAGCGQKGPLFLPRGPVAADRATLPQTIKSALPGVTPPAASPAQPASAPVPPDAEAEPAPLPPDVPPSTVAPGFPR